MGTRGLYGFYYKNKFYVVYNHCDSYPEHLGKLIVEEIQKALDNNQIMDWRIKMESLKVVNYDIKPTQEEIKKLKPYTDLEVSSESTDAWYYLLKKTQQSLEKVLDSGFIINDVDDFGRPYYEEYAYILNFDTNQLDYYEECNLIKSFEIEGFDGKKVIQEIIKLNETRSFEEDGEL